MRKCEPSGSHFFFPRSILVTWPLEDFMGNCHKIIAKGIDSLSALALLMLFHPPRPSSNPKRTQKVKMYEQTLDPGRGG
jgi:hypothetical protein